MTRKAFSKILKHLCTLVSIPIEFVDRVPTRVACRDIAEALWVQQILDTNETEVLRIQLVEKIQNGIFQFDEVCNRCGNTGLVCGEYERNCPECG
jgi:hypothetical protein